jgi:ABC-type sugar transport system, ATPase component
MENAPIVLKLKNIYKSFLGVNALTNVSLELTRGEIHALVGENGAGKTTLMKVLLGIHKADKGEIEFNGNLVSFTNPKDALDAGISMIHQEISMVLTMTVAENIWLGREKLFTKGPFLDKPARRKATLELLERFDLDIDPDEEINQLSIATMQMVEIARAVSYNSEIIVMDEPSSALTNQEIELLFRVIRKLQTDGITVVYISHKLEEVLGICERVSVLRDGRYVGTEQCKDLTEAQLIKMIVNRELKDIYMKTNIPGKEVAIEVKNLCRNGVFSDVNFSARKGEIVGFAGLMGSGRTEIMRAIFGVDRLTSGDIFIEGEKVSIKRTEEAIAQGLGMVTEDRLRTGCIYTLSVLHNATITNLKEVTSKIGLLKQHKESGMFKNVAKSLTIKYRNKEDLVGTLSGGNQQKVIISRWLLKKSKILIMDEPTRGIDVGSKFEIYKLINDLANEGMCILLISSELPELLGMSDRVLVLRKGEIVFECLREEATQELLMSHAFPS